jgi:hypothetical protein
MRLAAIAIVALLLLVITSREAPARKFGLGPLIGPVQSILRGAVRVRPYSYRSRGRYARRPSPARAAIAQRARAAQMARAGQMAALGALAAPVAFWPNASQDVFDYVLTPREDGLWAHGYGAVIASMFAQQPVQSVPQGAPQEAPKEAPQSDNVAGDQPAAPEQTTGAAPAGAAILACGEDRESHADAVTNWIRETLALAENDAVVTQLRSALTKADTAIVADCQRDIPATLPERLRALQDRLWTVRVAATDLRASLQDFDKALSKEQKAKLDPPSAPERVARSRSRQRAPEADMAGKLCYAQAQRAPQWPAEQIARAVRPNKDQQEKLAALTETSTKMSMMMMGACPQNEPATPQDRLNVTLDWLDNMLVATANVAVAVDDFYGSLNDEQKSKLDVLSL